jgi:hypothetical protein
LPVSYNQAKLRADFVLGMAQRCLFSEKLRGAGASQPGHWLLQDAKARFSELVRRVRSEEFRRLKGDLTGQALIAAMQASPHRDIDIEPRGVRMPVRDVAL